MARFVSEQCVLHICRYLTKVTIVSYLNTVRPATTWQWTYEGICDTLIFEKYCPLGVKIDTIVSNNATGHNYFALRQCQIDHNMLPVLNCITMSHLSVWFRGNSSDPFYSLDRRDGGTSATSASSGVHWHSPPLTNRTHFKLLTVKTCTEVLFKALVNIK